MWEDERNRLGGRWLINTVKGSRQQELDRLWLETVSNLVLLWHTIYFKSTVIYGHKINLLIG